MKKTPSHRLSRWHWPFSLGKTLFWLTAFLSLLGLFFIFEASSAESYRLVGNQYHFLRQQALSLSVGGALALCAWLVPVSFWKKIANIGFLAGIILLILVFIPGLGVELNGAHRWIGLQGRVFQPVEFFKLALIFFSASWMAKNPKPQTFLAMTGLFSVLVLLQPDMGSLLILLWIAFGLFFLAGGNLAILGGLGAVGAGLLVLLVLTSPYRLERLTTYLNPGSDVMGKGFHVHQMTLALGHGGWFGVGIGNSQQKYSYIPEASSDSIFAIVAEELGFVGSLVIVGVLCAYCVTLYRIAMTLPERSFEQLLVLGIFLWLGGQMLLNLAAVVVLVPLTGLPLPFFSYGGTALLTTLVATGVVLRVFRESSAVHSAPRRHKVQ